MKRKNAKAYWEKQAPEGMIPLHVWAKRRRMTRSSAHYFIRSGKLNHVVIGKRIFVELGARVEKALP